MAEVTERVEIPWERLARDAMSSTQVDVVELLSDGEQWSPKLLAEALGLPLANVAYHVGRLRQLGVVRLVRRAPRRGAVEHYYRMVGDARPGCPDGGTCHHDCGSECFRVQSCGPLSGVFENDEWPPDARPVRRERDG